MSLVRVTGSNFVRDTKSMGLINTDENSRNEYQSKVQMLKTQKEEINKVKSEIADLKNDISEIKQLMINLLGKGSDG